MSKDTFYFSHDCCARADRKLVNLQMKHGMEGIGVYWCIVEMLYEEGGRLKNDFELLSFALRCNKETIKAVVNDFELFVSDDVYFWSESIIGRINKRAEKSNSAKASVSHKWGNDLVAQNKLNRSQRLSAARLLGTHTKKDWEEMQEFFKNQCVKCGSDIYIVKDHIIPLYQGGSESLSNIQPLCHKCNAGKGSESVDYRKRFCEANAYEMPTKYLKTPTIKKSIVENSIEKNTTTGGVVFPDWIPKKTFDEYQATRKKKIKPQSLNRFFNSLKKICDETAASPEAILNQSIVNGWEGIFPIRSIANAQATAKPVVTKGYEPEPYQRPDDDTTKRLTEEARIFRQTKLERRTT